ncbi:MAG: 50S ribosomal protein L18 [Firmicutes bacterium]|nr:50S ribosomal protein L18 [Bacillota bacterium]
MIKKPDRNQVRRKRHQRVRNKINGSSEMPRLNVYRSLNNIYAQVINDEEGRTLAAASTLSPEVKAKLSNGSNVDAAKAVGELVAQRAVEKGVKKVAFDRAGYLYHGRVKALADAARENGLKF